MLLFAALANCQETLEGESSTVSEATDHKEKRGLSLNLGSLGLGGLGTSGLEGYSYLGPSNSRALNYRGYAPITDYGETIKLK
jgi:hypothetical protein